MDKVVFMNSQIACALIEMNSMIAENQQRMHRGEPMAYIEDDFMKLITKYDIGHNSVITYLTT